MPGPGTCPRTGRCRGLRGPGPFLPPKGPPGAARARRPAFPGAPGADFPRAFRLRVAQGRWLPKEDASQARAFAVLGSKVRQELYGNTNPLGSRIDIGGSRFRVIGVMESKGQVLGFDMDDAVYIPAARALELFNREGLMSIDVVHEAGADVPRLVEEIL